MPNLGQGGCQAIEDGFVLTDLLCSIDNKSQLKGVLQEYYRKRIVRSAIVQGMSRLSSDIIITSFSTPFKFSGTTRHKLPSRNLFIHPSASSFDSNWTPPTLLTQNISSENQNSPKRDSNTNTLHYRLS